MSSGSLQEAQATQTEKVAPFGRLWWVGLLLILVATLVSVILAQLGRVLLAVPVAFSPLGPGPISFFTIIGSLGAVIVFALLGAFTRRPIRIFRIVAIVVLVLSLIPDFLILVKPVFPSTTVTGIGVLIFLHIVVGAICIGVLTTLGRARS